MADRITIADVHGDFREFRGAVSARLGGLEESQREVLEELRAIRQNGTGTAGKVKLLEAAKMPERLASLELRWRLVLTIGGAVALMVAGLFVDLLRSTVFG